MGEGRSAKGTVRWPQLIDALSINAYTRKVVAPVQQRAHAVIPELDDAIVQ